MTILKVLLSATLCFEQLIFFFYQSLHGFILAECTDDDEGDKYVKSEFL